MKLRLGVTVGPYARHNNVTTLQGRDGYRLRVGDRRVVYDVQGDLLALVALELNTRRGIY